MIRATTFLGACLILLSACRKDDKVPSYLEVDTVDVQTDPGTEGSDSQKITELWVYLDQQTVGVWEPPARVPLLAEGPADILLVAGIRRNGISSDIIQYPFYANWNGTVDLVREGAVQVAPTFTYFDGLEFWIEAFDDPGYKFSVPAASDTGLFTVTDPALVFEGIASGAFYLDQAHPYFICETDEDFTVNGTGPVFLELDYRSDHRFLIGTYFTLNGIVIKEPYLFVAPTLRDDGAMPWNKIYVDLSSQFNLGGITDREFYIESQLDLDATSATIYLDNIKLVRN